MTIEIIEIVFCYEIHKNLILILGKRNCKREGFPLKFSFLATAGKY